MMCPRCGEDDAEAFICYLPEVKQYAVNMYCTNCKRQMSGVQGETEKEAYATAVKQWSERWPNE